MVPRQRVHVLVEDQSIIVAAHDSDEDSAPLGEVHARRLGLGAVLHRLERCQVNLRRPKHCTDPAASLEMRPQEVKARGFVETRGASNLKVARTEDVSAASEQQNEQ